MISLDFSDWSFGGDSEREDEVTNFLQEGNGNRNRKFESCLK